MSTRMMTSSYMFPTGEMVSVQEASLQSFFIYNTDYGQKEGMEHEKILLYIPTEESEDVKVKNMGLCEALVNFCRTFKARRECQTLHTKKTKRYFYNPESNIWMIMTVNIPEKVSTKDVNSTMKKVSEYASDEVQDPILMVILEQAYSMFVLFNGLFMHILNKYGLPVLKQRLQYFYSRYLLTLDFAALNVLDVYQGISYLPLDKSCFLKVCPSFLVLKFVVYKFHKR